MILPLEPDQQREAILDGAVSQQDWNSKFLALVRDGFVMSGRDSADEESDRSQKRRVSKKKQRVVVRRADSQRQLVIPDVSGMTPEQAALAYAEHGWYVLPVQSGTKNPGSVVGGDWDRKSSRRAEKIHAWWVDNPSYGIALHAGRSGAVVFDYDENDLELIDRIAELEKCDDLCGVAAALRSAGAIQNTRTAGDRGHYLFAVGPGEEYGNGAGAFARVGQVRGRNGVIIVAPSVHEKSDTDGGRYSWRKTGELTPLPFVLRKCLSAPGGQADPKTPQELDEFLSAHTGSDRAYALKGPLAEFDPEPGRRHDSMRDALCWGFREVVAGCYPARNLHDELKDQWLTATAGDRAGEFERLAAWAAAQAELTDPAETLERLDRNVWPSPNTPLLVANAVAERQRAQGQPLLFWREGWYRYIGTHYDDLDERELRKHLSDMLSSARYINKDGVQVPWNPRPASLKELVETLALESLVDKDLDAASWLDGRKHLVIPCSNGLLRVHDRMFLDHDPAYFSLYCLPFAYDARASAPRWVQFLDEVWPGDPEAPALLQEWFGYVLSGRTDLHKMLMLIGVTRSGKSTITKVLDKLVGPTNCAWITAEALVSRFGLAQLVGKPLAVFADERMTVRGNEAVGRILAITGEDAVPIEVKFKETYSARLPTRLMFCSNEVPTLPDAARAINNRVLSLHMDVSWLDHPDQDPGLANKLLLELPGIFNWALEGLARLDANGGHFTHAYSADRVGELLRAGASPLREFVEEKCILAPENRVAKDVLYGEWRLWAEANGRAVGSSADFGRKMFAAFGNAISNGKVGSRGRQRPAYRGIALQDDDFHDGMKRKR
ncbi:phage/plasmid primase, P4 family [Mycolicibacterium wolinskyi]|uniref:phage/plasmid primase, P4 family n=1 Tax=Mycolicibacterium wolinskyi TaxID=59750 RepID=UPI000A506F85|nr:phage/plasmid primase, P4 family [Mycolicibacterium wolinskyi]